MWSRVVSSQTSPGSAPKIARVGASPSSKQHKEVAISERVCLEAWQLVRSLQKATSAKAVVAHKTFKSLSDRLNSRLTAPLVKVYTDGYDASASSSTSVESDGMKTLEALRDVQVVLSRVEPVVQLIGLPTASGQELLRQLKLATCDKFSPAPQMFELPMTWELGAALASKDWSRIANLLTWVGDGSAGGGSELVCLQNIHEDQRGIYQEAAMVKLYTDLLKEEDKVAQVLDLNIALAGVPLLLTGEGTLSAELPRLRALCDPMSRTFPAKALEEGMEWFRTNKSAKLHKSLCYFPTGVTILKKAADAVRQRASDDANVDVLRQLSATVTTLKSDAPVLAANLSQTVNDLKPIHERYMRLRAACSKEFLAQHANHAIEVETYLSVRRDALVSAVSQHSLESASSVLKCFVEFASESQKGECNIEEANKTFSAAAEGTLKSMLSPEAILASVVDLEVLAKHNTTYSELYKLVQVLQTTFKVVMSQKDKFDFRNDAMGALYKYLASPASCLHQLDGFAAFQHSCDITLFAMVGRTVQHDVLIDNGLIWEILEALGSTRPADTTAIANIWKDKAAPGEIALAKSSLQSATEHGLNLLKATPYWLPRMVRCEGDDHSVEAELWLVALSPELANVALVAKDMMCEMPDFASEDSFHAGKCVDTVNAVDKTKAAAARFWHFFGTTVIGNDKEKSLPIKTFVDLIQEQCSTSLAMLVDGFIAACAKTKHTTENILCCKPLSGIWQAVESSCTETDLVEYMAIAQAPETRSLHECCKTVDRYKLCKQKLKDNNHLLPEQRERLQQLDLKFQDANNVTVAMAAVMSLSRPLKQDETRGQLARRARMMQTAKGASLPANLELLLNKHAAAMPTDDAAAKTSSAVSEAAAPSLTLPDGSETDGLASAQSAPASASASLLRDIAKLKKSGQEAPVPKKKQRRQ